MVNFGHQMDKVVGLNETINTSNTTTSARCYVTTDKYPYNEYCVHDLNTYVKTK